MEDPTDLDRELDFIVPTHDSQTGLPTYLLKGRVADCERQLEDPTDLDRELDFIVPTHDSQTGLPTAPRLVSPPRHPAGSASSLSGRPYARIFPATDVVRGLLSC